MAQLLSSQVTTKFAGSWDQTLISPSRRPTCLETHSCPGFGRPETQFCPGFGRPRACKSRGEPSRLRQMRDVDIRQEVARDGRALNGQVSNDSFSSAGATTSRKLFPSGRGWRRKETNKGTKCGRLHALASFTESEVAGLAVGALILLAAASAPQVDSFVARSQRSALGLCTECGGVAKLPCTKCKGTGRKKPLIALPFGERAGDRFDAKCLDCGGSGQLACPACGGSAR